MICEAIVSDFLPLKVGESYITNTGAVDTVKAVTDPIKTYPVLFTSGVRRTLSGKCPPDFVNVVGDIIGVATDEEKKAGETMGLVVRSASLSADGKEYVVKAIRNEHYYSAPYFSIQDRETAAHLVVGKFYSIAMAHAFFDMLHAVQQAASRTDKA